MVRGARRLVVLAGCGGALLGFAPAYAALGSLTTVLGPGVVPTTSLSRADVVSLPRRFGVSPERLASLPQRPLPGDARWRQETVATASVSCAVGRCGRPPAIESLGLQLSDAATTKFTLDGGVIDPQLAAGPSFLVVTMRDRIRFLSKSGTPLPNLDGSPNTGYTDLCDFFGDDLIDQMNADLGLPTAQTDSKPLFVYDTGQNITVQNGYGINCVDFPNDTFYDARVLWDPFRKRFWVGALVINQATSVRPFGGPVDRPRDPDVRAARRGRFAVAVSRTADPREGWDFAFTDVNYENDRCPSAVPAENGRCDFEFVSDYPAMGISPRYLTVSMEAGKAEIDVAGAGRRRSVFAIPADGLASTGTCQPCVVQRPAGGPDGALADFVPSGRIQETVMHHPPANPAYSQWISSHARVVFQTSGLFGLSATVEDYLQTLTLVDDGSAAPYFVTSSTVVRRMRGPGDVALARQKAHPDLGSMEPARVSPSFGYTNVFSAAQRGGTTHVVLDECTGGTDDEPCITSIRYIRLGVDIGGFGVPATPYARPAPALDTSFGGYANAAGTQNSGFPFLGVNRSGDAVIAHISSNASIYPQARYTVIPGSSPTPMLGRTLQDGEYTVGNYRGDSLPTKVDVPHYLDASVDPFDDTAVWVIAPYGRKGADQFGVWGAAVGKVLGEKHPDRDVENLRVQVDDVYTIEGPKKRIRVSFLVYNFGDAPSSQTTVHVTLREGASCGSAVQTPHIDGIPSLQPGAAVQKDVVLMADLAPRSDNPLDQLRCIHVFVNPFAGPQEYDLANNHKRELVTL